MASTAMETVERHPAAPDVLQVLVENHRRFLAFLERRLGSREAAEDLLQEGFARAIARAPTLRDGDSVVAWFYRLLRNAVTDHYRRRGAEDRALAWVAGTTEPSEPGPDPDLHATVCGCVGGLVGTLKPEYAKALQRVELDGISVAAYAQETGITSNNAGVRLYRAREALRRQVILSCGTCCKHGCLDCACGEPRRP